MEMMILGLILFLGTHSLRIFAEDFRTSAIERMGPNAFKGVYSLISLAGIILMAKGHDNALVSSTWGWTPATFTRHLAVLLMLFAIIMLVSTYIPNNHIKSKLKHPMILSVKVWALAHLISNGEGANVILFGSFLAWAVIDFRFARQRDRQITHDIAGELSISSSATNSTASTIICVLLGAVIWIALVAYLHNLLFGVYPIIIPGVIGSSATTASFMLPT